MIEGRDGKSLDIDAMAAAIPDVIAAGGASLELSARWKAISPTLTGSDLENLVQEAAVVVNSKAKMKINNFVVPLPPEVAATWFSSEVTVDGVASLVMDNALALADLEQLMAPGNVPGSDVAVFEVIDGEVVVTASQPRRRC